jgi:hypothetical protein
MATILTNLAQSKVISNLDTYNHTAVLNSMYYVSCILTEQPNSTVSITIEQNGTPVTSIAAPGNGRTKQCSIVCQTVLNCAINDLISIVISSSNPIDQAINSIKGIINIHPGSV